MKVFRFVLRILVHPVCVHCEADQACVGGADQKKQTRGGGTAGVHDSRSVFCQARNLKKLMTFLKHVWGRMTAGDAQFKDCICVGDQAIEWDWNTDGTTHSRPGFKPEALSKWLDEHPSVDTVVLTTGVDDKLQVAFDPIAFAAQRHKNVTIHVLNTVPAVAKYNELLMTTNAGHLLGFFHSTC